jgi:Raf kinase inhibitor-like YbhB/YbcL family protein
MGILQYNQTGSVIINGFEDMFDTLTVIAYLLGNEPVHPRHLQLQAQFLEKEKTTCVQTALSPQLKWKSIPPEATSLALIIKDKKEYYWVVYNLPAQINGLPYGANVQMTPHDEGLNSWGQKKYHALCPKNVIAPVTVELYALDKRFDAVKPMTGELLERKIQGHVLAKAILRS